MMFQPPESQKRCPRCGNEDTRLLLDIDHVLPRLDELGYPQYFCLGCSAIFTVLDSPRAEDERGEEKT